jgi:hypothetical protein
VWNLLDSDRNVRFDFLQQSLDICNRFGTPIVIGALFGANQYDNVAIIDSVVQ